MTAPDRKRLVVRSHNGTFTIELDGEPLTCVSRLELGFGTNGQAEARLTVPAALIDLDADVAAFVTAHSDQDDDTVTYEQVIRGEKTINQYRAARGLPPWSADAVAETEAALRAKTRRPLPWRRNA